MKSDLFILKKMHLNFPYRKKILIFKLNIPLSTLINPFFIQISWFYMDFLLLICLAMYTFELPIRFNGSTGYVECINC